MPSKPPLPPSLNQQAQLRRLYKGRPYQIKRSDLILGTIPAYWGPNQDEPDANGVYQPPQDWPDPGTLLRVPRVARWFWEAPNVQTEVWIAAGVTGTYTYGQHYILNDFTLTTPPGVFPYSTHTVELDQHGLSFYGTPFTLTTTGHLSVPNGEFDAFGSFTYWIYTGYIEPPIILEEYEDRSSLTYQAVSLIWTQLSAGFIPAKTEYIDGIPPLTQVPSGPSSVGICFPVKTGVYYINNVPYGTRKNPNLIGLTIPDGWAQPPPLDSDAQAASDWSDVQAALTAKYANSTNPYFTGFPKDSIDDFLSIVTPIEDGFFGTHCVNFILLSTVHDVPTPNDPRVARIKATYQYFATYVVVIMIDTHNLADQVQAGEQINVNAFIAAIELLVASLEGCGWFMEIVDYDDTSYAETLMVSYINKYLQPDLNDAPPNLGLYPQYTA